MKKSKFWKTLAVAALVIPCAVIFAACGSPFGKSEKVTLDSIAVYSPSSMDGMSAATHKTSYRGGEALDITNLRIVASYSNGTSRIVDVKRDWITGVYEYASGNTAPLFSDDNGSAIDENGNFKRHPNFVSSTLYHSAYVYIGYENKTTRYSVSIQTYPIVA